MCSNIFHDLLLFGEKKIENLGLQQPLAWISHTNKSEVLPSQQHTRNLLDMPSSHDKLMLAHVKFQINSTSQTQGGIMRLS